MPNSCEVKLHLLAELATKAQFIATAANRIHELISADGNISPPEKSEEMKSLRIELHMRMEDWERAREEIQKHRVSHGC